MKSWNIIDSKYHIKKIINISIIVRKIIKAKKLSEQQFIKKIHIIFYQQNRIFSHFYIKKNEKKWLYINY